MKKMDSCDRDDEDEDEDEDDSVVMLCSVIRCFCSNGFSFCFYSLVSGNWVNDQVFGFWAGTIVDFWREKILWCEPNYSHRGERV